MISSCLAFGLVGCSTSGTGDEAGSERDLGCASAAGVGATVVVVVVMGLRSCGRGGGTRVTGVLAMGVGVIESVAVNLKTAYSAGERIGPWPGDQSCGKSFGIQPFEYVDWNLGADT